QSAAFADRSHAAAGSLGEPRDGRRAAAIAPTLPEGAGPSRPRTPGHGSHAPTFGQVLIEVVDAVAVVGLDRRRAVVAGRDGREHRGSRDARMPEAEQVAGLVDEDALGVVLAARAGFAERRKIVGRVGHHVGVGDPPGAVGPRRVIAGEGRREAAAGAGAERVAQVEHRPAVAEREAGDRADARADARPGAGAVPGARRDDRVADAGGAAAAVGDRGIAAAVDDQIGHAVPGAAGREEDVGRDAAGDQGEEEGERDETGDLHGSALLALIVDLAAHGAGVAEDGSLERGESLRSGGSPGGADEGGTRVDRRDRDLASRGVALDPELTLLIAQDAAVSVLFGFEEEELVLAGPEGREAVGFDHEVADLAAERADDDDARGFAEDRLLDLDEGLGDDDLA